MQLISRKLWMFIGIFTFTMAFIAVLLKRPLGINNQAVTIFVCVDVVIFFTIFFFTNFSIIYGSKEKMKITDEILRHLKEKTDKLYRLYPKDHIADKNYFK